MKQVTVHSAEMHSLLLMLYMNVVVQCVQSQAGSSAAVAAAPTKAAGGLFSADMGKEKEIMREEVSTATIIYTHYTLPQNSTSLLIVSSRYCSFDCNMLAARSAL
jgi:hypothetical protein